MKVKERREKARLRQRRWRQNHAEERRAYNREWMRKFRAANREKEKEFGAQGGVDNRKATPI